MSYEVLIEGIRLSKSYAAVEQPFAVFLHALLPSIFSAPKYRNVLDSIDLSVNRGETVGIVGRNGAGKTTLLGIMGGVIVSSSGEVRQQGRVVTLLGLSTGINVNFTGQENALLFCSIHRISRHQVQSVVNKIKEFAELGEYFNLPLRVYSSGMLARFSFACAVNVFADLIIIDETLAVGDANFKLKCYDKIKEMQAAGQSFLLVSHSQNLVANYCTRVVVIDNGKKIFDGNVIEGLNVYKEIRSNEEMLKADSYYKSRSNKRSDKLNADQRVVLKDPEFKLLKSHTSNARAEISLYLLSQTSISGLKISWGIRTAQGIIIAHYSKDDETALSCIPAGSIVQVNCSFDCLLKPGKYFFSISIHEMLEDTVVLISTFPDALSFDILGRKTGGIVDLKLNMSVVDVSVVNTSANA